jgi:heptose I phosphotransferase
MLRRAGLVDASSVFDNPSIQIWRSITERENCVLDLRETRLHIKRNKPGFRDADDEVPGLRLLEQAGVLSVPLAAHGRLNDGRGFVITEHLHGFEDSEELLERGVPFERLLAPTAQLTGHLHRSGLHHRDLYLNHFWANVGNDPIALRLIDAARVRKLPQWFRRRWLVKDLAQFVFSLRKYSIADTLVDEWLNQYARASGTQLSSWFRASISRKVAWIARNDARLRRRHPTRNVRIDR